MKPLLVIGTLLATASLATAQGDRVSAEGARASASRIVERGPHNRVWSRTEAEATPFGDTRQVEHRFVELCSGLHYTNEEGAWVDSSTEIEVFPGYAVARKNQHKAIFASNLATFGAIDLQLPSGLRVVTHVLGLSYFDEESGRSVLIAEVKDCTGVVDRNQVIYEDAFTDIRASVRFTVTLDGLEQDILLLERLPLPETFGLNSRTTTLQVLTEFIDPPQVTKRAERVEHPDGTESAGEEIDFGSMRMSRGNAFRFDAGKPEGSIRVKKTYRKLDNRDFLIEEVPVRYIANELDRLPAHTGSIPSTGGKAIPRTASLQLKLPAAPRTAALTKSEPMLLARYTPPTRSFLLDYKILNSTLTNQVFQADTTYYLSGPVNLYGSIVMEGGSVIKFTNVIGSDLWAYGSIQWDTGPYRPVIFTSKDDDSLGEAIPGSSGNPQRQLHVALVTTQSGTVRNARFMYARVGLCPTASVVAEDCQWVDCGQAVGTYCQSVTLRNALCSKVDNVVCGFQAGLTVKAEHLTADSFSSIMLCTTNTILSSLNLTNCLFTAGTNWVTGQANPTILTNGVVWQSSNSGIFQKVLAGGYYLADSSPFRNVGKTNMASSTLALIRSRTTYPPLVLSNVALSIDTTFTPQVQRDTDIPDLGYHYAPLDYICTNVVASNVIVRVTAGTAFGFGCGLGLVISRQASFIADGTASQPIQFVFYPGVQEDLIHLPAGNYGMSAYPIYSYRAGTAGGQGRFRFTQFSSLATDTFALYQVGQWGFNPLLVRDCEFRNCRMLLDQDSTNEIAQAILANNLLVHVQVGTESFDDRQGVDFYANTLRKGSFFVYNYGPSAWNIHDNLFHEANVEMYMSSQHGYNAYVGTNVVTDPPRTTNDVQLASFAFASGPLGDYYHAQTNLVDRGSVTNAASLGLYHHTTQTNQLKEANTRVDIGFHYVACAANGNPFDTDGDGFADYLEDANGDGTTTGDATSWQAYNSPNQLSQPGWLRVFTPIR